MSVSWPQPFAASAGNWLCACATLVKVSMTKGVSTLNCIFPCVQRFRLASTLACSAANVPSTQKPNIWAFFSARGECISTEPGG